MPTGSYTCSVSGGGVSISSSSSFTGDGSGGCQVTVPSGKSGTLSTRTDNDTGVATVSTGHGITTADKVSVFWTGGRRYNMTVSATASTTIDIDGGSGDNLPVATTAIVVSKDTNIVLSVDGDNAELFALSMDIPNDQTSKGFVRAYDGAANVATFDMTMSTPLVYAIASGATNPITGNVVTSFYASNGNSSTDATLTIIAITDATP